MKVEFPEYEYTGLSGTKYVPFFENGQWCLIPPMPCSFLNLVLKCNIPDEEATLLKLKYGS